MSQQKLKREAARWLLQARDDLDAAHHLLVAGKLAQAGFYSQQAAEKPVKAVLVAVDADPGGHSITKLIDELPEPPRASFVALRDQALTLDKLYIPTRYPDAVPDLIPAEAFSKDEIERAWEIAGRFVERAAAALAA